MMNDCLIWELSRKTNGYGQTYVDGKNQVAHRVAWQALYGEIPQGMVLDHVCHNEAVARGECDGQNCEHRACYNPNHLRLVTQKENTLSGLHAIDVKGGFKCGHEMIEKNILTRKSGYRECKECLRIRGRKHYYMKKAS
jgi:hypothetical protein